MKITDLQRWFVIGFFWVKRFEGGWLIMITDSRNSRHTWMPFRRWSSLGLYGQSAIRLPVYASCYLGNGDN